MKKGLTILVGVFMFLCTSPTMANAQGNKISEMTRIRVNGVTKELDSQSARTLVSEVTKYLGQESIVIQPRKTTKPISYSWKIAKLNNPKANLPTMIRVVINGKPVIDSQYRTKLTAAIMGAVQSDKKVEVSPRAIYKKMVQAQAIVNNVVPLAKKGQVPGSKQIAIGSTEDELQNAFGDPTEVANGRLPNTAEVTCSKKQGSKDPIDQIQIGHDYDQDQVIYLTAAVSTPDDQLTGHDIFKVLGKPVKTHNNISLGEAMAETGKDLPPGTANLTIYTFKAGAYNLYILEFNYTPSTEKITFSWLGASVDKNGEIIESVSKK